MKKKIIAVLLATCLCALTQGRGQMLQPKAKTLVRLPEQGGHWTVQFKPLTAPNPTASSAKGGQAATAIPLTLTSIDVVCTKDARRDRLQMSDGSSKDVWKIKGEWFFPARKDEVLSMNLFPGAQVYPGWKPFDKGEFQQIAASGTGIPTVYRTMPVIYYGSESVRTEKASSFMASIESIVNIAKNPAPSRAPTKTALGLFVDPETLFPVIYREPTGDYFFTNISEGPQSLEAPKEFASVAKRMQDARYVAKPPGHP